MVTVPTFLWRVTHPRMTRLVLQGHNVVMAPHRPSSAFWCPQCKAMGRYPDYEW